MKRPSLRTAVMAGFLGATAFLGFGTSDARAQSGMYTTQPGATANWGGYAPASGWTYYRPAGNPGYVVATPTAPAGTVYAAPPAGASAWQGYAPGRAWQGYAPNTVMTAPGRAPQAARAQAAQPRVHHRESGTGRNIYMHKPWSR